MIAVTQNTVETFAVTIAQQSHTYNSRVTYRIRKDEQRRKDNRYTHF